MEEGVQDREARPGKEAGDNQKSEHVTLRRPLWTKGRGASRGKATAGAPEAEQKDGASHPSPPHTPPPSRTLTENQQNNKKTPLRGFQEPEPARPLAGTFPPPASGVALDSWRWRRWKVETWLN